MSSTCGRGWGFLVRARGGVFIFIYIMLNLNAITIVSSQIAKSSDSLTLILHLIHPLCLLLLLQDQFGANGFDENVDEQRLTYLSISFLLTLHSTCFMFL